MYKDYTPDDYKKVVDECADRLRELLHARYNEIEEFRHAVNDRYPWEDLLLRWAEIDNEKELINHLLMQLDICAADMKDKIN